MSDSLKFILCGFFVRFLWLAVLLLLNLLLLAAGAAVGVPGSLMWVPWLLLVVGATLGYTRFLAPEVLAVNPAELRFGELTALGLETFAGLCMCLMSCGYQLHSGMEAGGFIFGVSAFCAAMLASSFVHCCGEHQALWDRLFPAGRSGA